jgi:hypothetical protein
VRALELQVCKQRIGDYNRGSYRGKLNVSLDRKGYELFAQATGASSLPQLVELVRFVGEDYGGAQARFLDDGYLTESERIARALLAVQREYVALARGQGPLVERTPDRATLARLAAPFNASKF